MFSQRFRFVVCIAAFMVLAGTTNAADEVKKNSVAAADEIKKKPVTAPRGFLEKFLAPQMDTRLKGEFQAAEHFTNPAANPWTKDDATVSRVEKGAIRATKGALKRYAIESMGINTWSLPLARGRGTGLDALKTESGGTRLRFGFSHLAPRAEVLIPVEAGRVSFGADALGRVSTSFEMPDSRFRVGAAVDPRAHEGTFSLSLSF